MNTRYTLKELKIKNFINLSRIVNYVIRLYVPGKDSSELVEQIKKDFPRKDFPGLEIKVDKELVFYKHLTPLIDLRKEICTIRFRPNTIRIPGGEYGVVPWIETDPNDERYGEQIGTIKIPLIVVADLESFPLGLALLGEYSNKEEMIENIQNSYNHILTKEDILSAYFLGELMII